MRLLRRTPLLGVTDIIGLIELYMYVYIILYNCSMVMTILLFLVPDISAIFHMVL
jgi:hypothetical protein